MKSLYMTFWAEFLKVMRSKIFPITIIAFLFIIFMVGFLLFAIKHPESSHKFGLVGTKAAMLRFAKLDWPAYLEMLNLFIAGLGIVASAITASWVFGREYSDRTLKDLLALPVSRYLIVLSKFIVIAIWSSLLAAITYSGGLLAGLFIDLQGWSEGIFFHSVCRYTNTFLLTMLLCPPIAFFANFGKGFLPPIGFLLLMMFLVQMVGLVGLSPYFPWAIPMLYGQGGADAASLTNISYAILSITSLAGLIATFAWWKYADHM